MDRNIIDYLPHVLREFREFRGICESEQTEIEKLYEQYEKVLDEEFVITAGSYGLSRWEKILGLTVDESENVSERRFRLISLMASKLPYTLRMLKQQLTYLCGEDGYIVEVDSLILKVYVALGISSEFNAVKELVSNMVPANLAVTVTIMYCVYSKLTKYKHSELKSFTHEGLRNRNEEE